MYNVDVPKVRGKMAEKGYTISSLATEMGINRNTLAGYLDNPSNIPYGKLAIMADILCDDSTESTNIFFAPNLRNTKVL